MSDIALIHCTFPDAVTAERIAMSTLDERLAACVNLLAPCTSLFRWQGGVKRAQEVPALFKTTPELEERLRQRILALHPYDLPVIEAWPVAAGGAVYDWVNAETGA